MEGKVMKKKYFTIKNKKNKQTNKQVFLFFFPFYFIFIFEQLNQIKLINHEIEK